MADRGKRYTEAEKKRIVEFAVGVGRGGISAASKRFEVSPLTVSRWMKGAGKTSAKRGRKSAGRASKTSASGLPPKAHSALHDGLEKLMHGLELVAEALGHVT